MELSRDVKTFEILRSGDSRFGAVLDVGDGESAYRPMSILRGKTYCGGLLAGRG
jgi:hypothetical protein